MSDIGLILHLIHGTTENCEGDKRRASYALMAAAANLACDSGQSIEDATSSLQDLFKMFEETQHLAEKVN